MTTSTYSIAFDFQLESSNFKIPVTADVEVHHSVTYYVIKNIRTRSNQNRPVIPDITIRKLDGRWVHTDSEKETALSMMAGKAIDDAQNGSDEKS